MKIILSLIVILAVVTGCGRERKEEQPPAPEPAPLPEKSSVDSADTEQKAPEVQPKTFEESLLAIRELEENAEFGEAIRICRVALAQTTDPVRTEILGQIMQRLVLSQNEALELSFAVRNLTEGKDRSLTIARQKLKESGETGRILLRKAVREGNETSVLEAGAILVELEDKYVPTVFVERLRTNPPGPVLKALVKVLRESKQELDYGLISELCESAKEEGPTRLVLMNIIMDSLEQSVTLPQPTEEQEKPGEEKIEPALDKLPAQIGNLGPQVVETLTAFLLQQAVRPKDAQPQPPEEIATVERAKLILILAPFPSCPPLLVQKLTQDQPAPATELLAGLLYEMTGRIDSETLGHLAKYAASGGLNQTVAVDILMDSLEKSVTPPPPADKPDEKMTPALDKLPARLDRKLQSAVLSALITFVETQSAPPPNGAPAQSQKEKDVFAQASNILVKSVFPETASRLIAALIKNPAAPTADALVAILKQIKFDNDDIRSLAEYTAATGPYHTDTAILLMDSLEKSVTPPPPADKPDEKMTPALDKLPARLDRKLQSAVRSALITFVETQSAPPPNGAPAQSQKEKDVFAQASNILAKSGFPETANKLIAALIKNPAAPTADALIAILKQIKFDNDDIRSLAEYTATAGPYQTDTAILLMDSLEKSVTPPPPADKPDEKMAPALDKLPARLNSELQSAILSALTTFIESQSAPPPNGAQERTQKEKDALAKAAKLLIHSRLPQTPALLVEKLATNPDGPAVSIFADILKELSAGLDAGAIAELSRAVSGETKGSGIIRDLVIHILSQQKK